MDSADTEPASIIANVRKMENFNFINQSLKDLAQKYAKIRYKKICKDVVCNGSNFVETQYFASVQNFYSVLSFFRIVPVLPRNVFYSVDFAGKVTEVENRTFAVLFVLMVKI